MMRRRKRIGWWENEGSERRGEKSISFHYTLPSIWYMVLRGAGREESQMIIRDDGISLQFIVPLRRRERKCGRERESESVDAENQVDERRKMHYELYFSSFSSNFLPFRFTSSFILSSLNFLLLPFTSLHDNFLPKWQPFRYIVQDIHA